MGYSDSHTHKHTEAPHTHHNLQAWTWFIPSVACHLSPLITDNQPLLSPTDRHKLTIGSKSIPRPLSNTGPDTYELSYNFEGNIRGSDVCSLEAEPGKFAVGPPGRNTMLGMTDGHPMMGHNVPGPDAMGPDTLGPDCEGYQGSESSVSLQSATRFSYIRWRVIVRMCLNGIHRE